MTRRDTSRRSGAPDFDDIHGFETDPRKQGTGGLIVSAIMLAIVAGLFSLAMLAVSMGQARADRPPFCAPYPSIAECMAAAQEMNR